MPEGVPSVRASPHTTQWGGHQWAAWPILCAARRTGEASGGHRPLTLERAGDPSPATGALSGLHPEPAGVLRETRRAHCGRWSEGSTEKLQGGETTAVAITTVCSSCRSGEGGGEGPACEGARDRSGGGGRQMQLACQHPSASTWR